MVKPCDGATNCDWLISNLVIIRFCSKSRSDLTPLSLLFLDLTCAVSSPFVYSYHLFSSVHNRPGCSHLATIWHFYMQMQILIAFTGCRDMARPSVLWPFGGMKLPFLCCAHCLFPILELTETKDFSPSDRTSRSFLPH